MKVINDKVLNKILNLIDISLNEILYYTSGKCGDLYLYKNKLLKILKWYVKDDDIKKVEAKFNEKISFINYLNNNNFECLSLNKLGDNYFKVIEIDNFIYVIYIMEYLVSDDNTYDKSLVGERLLKLHKLSRKYKNICHNSWKEEYDSVYSSCKNDNIKMKLKYYYNEINSLDINSNNYGIIHYDSNKNNYILSDNLVYMIDFDSICNGFYLMDIANYLFSIYNIDFINGIFMEQDEFKQISNSILEKYNFDYKDIDLLNVFINYRLTYIYSILFEFINDIKVKKKIENIIFNKNKFFILK